MEAALTAPHTRPQVFTSGELSNEAYHAETGHVSSSQLVHVLDSPAHFQYHATHDGPEESDLMRLGSAVHCMLLEPAAFSKRYIFAPRNYDRRLKADKSEIEAISAVHPDRVLISPKEAATLHNIVQGINAHAKARELLSAPGDAELSIFWRDDLTGIPLKVRLDRYARVGPHGTMVEIKSTDSASAHKFGFKVTDMAYDMRAVMYTDAVQKAFGFTPDIVWIVIERDTGFVATYRPPIPMLFRARALYEQARMALKDAQTSNRWTAYQTGEYIETLEMPRKRQPITAARHTPKGAH